MAKEKVYVVIGLGTFGRQLCETFIAQGASVIAVDNRSELIERIKDTVTQAVMIDATEEDSLSQIPFDDVDVAIVAIGDNIEASILVTALLKRMGITYILARAISELHMQVLRQVGADEVVNLEIDEGKRIAQRLSSPEVLDRTQISDTISLAELYLPEKLAGKRLDQLDLRKKHRINIVAVKRTIFSVDEIGNPNKTEEVLFPVPSTILEGQDILLVVGKNDAIEQFREEL
ncbi:MAG: potassium channel family protein [Spirochaetaceae bacterium]